jgi:hypothetical protein
MADGPMSPGAGRTDSGRLDGPPPLPSEAKRKTNWMKTDSGDDMGLGAMAQDPMVQIAMASKKIEEGIQQLGIAAPALQPQLGALTTAIRQMAANALVQQPGPPGMGGMQAPMPMPPPPGPPTPQAGPPAVQQ